MAKTECYATVRIVFHGAEPYIESRLRAVDDAADAYIPKGKILVLRAPFLGPAKDEDETRTAPAYSRYANSTLPQPRCLFAPVLLPSPGLTGLS